MSLDDLRKKVEDLKETMKVEGSALLHEETKKIFEKYPKLESFGWKQYTCYFNDGDSCYFAVHGDYPDINGESYEDYEDNEDNKWIEKASGEIAKLLGSVDDILQDLYDDHKEITIHRNGDVEESDYTDHD